MLVDVLVNVYFGNERHKLFVLLRHVYKKICKNDLRVFHDLSLLRDESAGVRA